MDTLQIFNYEGNQIRMIEKNGEPWLVLADVCRVLELTNSRKVSERLDDDEKDVTQIYTPGGLQEMTIINESGLYNVILRSDSLPPAQIIPYYYKIVKLFMKLLTKSLIMIFGKGVDFCLDIIYNNA